MLKVDLAEAAVDAHIVPDDVRSVAAIVGQPLTDRPDVTVLQRGGELRLFKEGSEAMLREAENLPPRKIELWASEATVIPTGESANVKVMTKGTYDGDVFVDFSIHGKENEEHCIPRCVINTSSGLLPIVNLSDKDLHIKKGRVIARGEGTREATHLELRVMTVRGEGKNVANLAELPREDIKIGPQFPEEKKNELVQILNDYRDCFALNMSELGKTDLDEMIIELTCDTPVYYHSYRLAYSERERVKELIQEMKDNGIIRDSSSPFASPILLVRKKNGEVRMCVDYRGLNSITKKIRFPLPLIEDRINSLGGASVYISLDMASGYYLVPVAEKDIEKTAFVTPDGQYEFLRQPFGYANAPSAFARPIAKVIAPLRNKNSKTIIQAYIDDIRIAARDLEAAMQALVELLERLRKSGLTLKLSKCKFVMAQTEFLGYEISEERLRPGKLNTEAVEKFRTPTNVHEVRSFIGLASYFRTFMLNFALIARSLTMLTKKMQEWVWGVDQEHAFAEIKRILTSRPVLAIYRPDAETELHTDASKLGLGAILLQKQSSNKLHPVTYFSRQTTKEEQRYHSCELETLAVVSSLHRFRVYVLGLKFKVVSDCKALRATFTKRDLSPRIGRWWIQLQEYDCTIEYRAGAKMPHVDALSRNAIEDCGNAAEIQGIGIFHIDLEDQLLVAQLQDERLKYVNEVLGRAPRDTEEREIKTQYFKKNERIFRQTEAGAKWAVPRAMRRNYAMMRWDT